MEFTWTKGKTGIDGCRLVRKKVFVEEQGFSEENEFDETDSLALHLLMSDGGKPVGAARIFPGADRCWHIGRLCVLAEYRGRRLGKLLLEEAEAEARRQGALRVELGAQKRASGFYQGCGYTPCGAEYMDEFCPHLPMGKDLS
ncbi:MAG: GNAT family N-acetyltransferase [Oscillospiraceae bacterium]|jgi:predicted GNAT family N-acyltransferase|nr:GNAT family N-acetyltransferase [Oscillospiraceae bacterium]